MLKLYFEKAYDMVDWNFLLEVLYKKGFEARWISWIKGCISSTSFSILINGKLHGRFKASGGLHQGDPLATFLSVLVADVLSRMLDKGVMEGCIEGFTVVWMARRCLIYSLQMTR